LTELTLRQANNLIGEIFKAASEKDMPPIAVAVLDTGAHLKALQREVRGIVFTGSNSAGQSLGGVGYGVKHRADSQSL